MDSPKAIILTIVSLLVIIAECDGQKNTSIDDCLQLIQKTSNIEIIDSCRRIGEQSQNIELISRSEYFLGRNLFEVDDYKAFEYSAHAYAIRKGPEDQDPAFTLKCGYNAAFFSKLSGLLDSQYYYLNDVIESGIINETSVRARQDLGVYFAEHGNFPLARTYFTQCFELQSELNSKQIFNLHLDHSKVILDEAKVELESNRPNLAKKVISEADVYLTSLDIELIAKNDLAKYYQNIGLAYRHMDNYDKAIEYTKKALALNIDSDVEADLYNNLGIYYKHQSNHELSITYLKKAIQQYQELDKSENLYLAYDNYGETLLKMELFEDAIDYFNQAICTVIPDYINCDNFTTSDIKNMSTLPSIRKKWLMVFLTDKARCYYEWYKKEKQTTSLQSSIKSYVLADLMVSIIRNAIPQESGQFQWRSKAKDIYEPAIEAGFAADSLDLVLRFMERSKSMMLHEAMQRAKATDLLNQNLRNELLSNRSAVNALEKELYVSDDKNSPEALVNRDSLLNLELRYSELMRDISVTNPSYYQAIYKDDNIGLTQIQEELQTDQAIISFFATQDELIGAIISKSRIEFKSITSRHQIDSLLSNFQDLMGNYDELRSYSLDQYQAYIPKLASYSNALYQVLIASWSDLSKNIVIIPSENLAELNFEGLVTDQPSSDVSITAWPYLINDHNISYSPSIAIWLEMQGKQTTGRKLTTYTPNFSGSSFADLSETQSQINRRLPPFKTKNYSDMEASFENLGSYDNEAIIHLATHAVLNLEESEFSFLLLNDSQGGLDTIYLKDIYHIETPGAFIVVNACETSRGTSSRGEGVISLARAFIYAGASGLITSLWPVNDHVSGILMHHFYENLKDGLQKDEALRQAKLSYLAQTKTELAAHPYLWASLIHIGNNDPIEISPFVNLQVWLIPITLVVLLIGIYFTRKSKRKPCSSSPPVAEIAD